MSRLPASNREMTSSISGSNQASGAARRLLPHPHDWGSLTAEGGHVGEVLILGHDDGSMFERVAPLVAIG
jgi:hypothetical protein